jgi:IS30 family transposase
MGGEFADHARVAKETGTDIFFAKPYASWQRGTNTNLNGRVRRFWPKKFDMATLTDKEIEDNVFLLNMTPKKVLGGLTPWKSLLASVLHLLLESSFFLNGEYHSLTRSLLIGAPFSFFSLPSPNKE